MKALLVILFALTAGLSYGQGFSYPTIKQGGKTIGDFVPPGWTILDSAKGDLNNDKLVDAVIILQHTDRIKLPKDTGDTDVPARDTAAIQHRILIILFKNPGDRKYYLAAQSNNLIIAVSDPSLTDGPPLMEDPYQEMKIDHGLLQVSFGLSYSAGGWSVTNTAYKFRYRQNRFELIGANYYSADRATHDFYDYSFNFLSKKRRLEKGNEEKGIKKISWKSLDVAAPALKSLKTAFTWEIEPGVFL